MGIRDQFRLASFKLDYSHPHRFVSAKFNNKPLYACWRVFWALYHVIWVLLSWVLEPWVTYPALDRLKWFVYLTNWMYLLLTLETVLEAINFLYVHLLRYEIIKGKKCQMPWYLKMQWVLYEIVSTGSLMVTAWYWAAVYKGDRKVGPVNFSLHAMNSIYVLLNLLLTATPTRLLHFVYPVLFGVAYTAFTFAYHLAGGTNIRGQPFVYSVLDWDRPGRTVLVSAISNLLAIPVMHLLLFLLHALVQKMCTCRRADGQEGGEGGRPVSGTTCLGLDEPGMESSSVQGELLGED